MIKNCFLLNFFFIIYYFEKDDNFIDQMVLNFNFCKSMIYKYYKKYVDLKKVNKSCFK